CARSDSNWGYFDVW
nr:immunoglobulin heavy chain junction region [Mus musculus]